MVILELADFRRFVKAIPEESSACKNLLCFAEHLAQMSSGFDPLGLQNAFKTIQQQNDVIRQQHEVIYRLQQLEIQRLKQENQQLKMADKSAKSQPRLRKKKRIQR